MEIDKQTTDEASSLIFIDIVSQDGSPVIFLLRQDALAMNFAISIAASKLFVL